jgi:hypothetical protein
LIDTDLKIRFRNALADALACATQRLSDLNDMASNTGAYRSYAAVIAQQRTAGGANGRSTPGDPRPGASDLAALIVAVSSIRTALAAVATELP